ncbi:MULTISPECIES: hypothetical protein [Helcococcus]|uniref:Uncharacterized protein n=1 Tax=Helcococcus bovis TaxID=3153252 RepID=A0ABW9F8E8_9FIRM
MNSLIHQRKKLELNKKYKISRLTNEFKVSNRDTDKTLQFLAKLIAHEKHYMIFDIDGVKECFMYGDPHVRIEEV